MPLAASASRISAPTALTTDQLTIPAVAEILSCSPDTVRRMIARGDLKAFRVGKRLIRIRRSDLERAMRPVTRIDLVTAGGGSE